TRPAVVKPTASPTATMLTMPDKSQDDVVVGQIGIARPAPDYLAAAIMNLSLGGDEFVGRVGKRVRDTEGLAYYAYTAFEPGLHAGPWAFRAGVNPQNVNHAVASFKDELRRFLRDGITPDELA